MFSAAAARRKSRGAPSWRSSTSVAPLRPSSPAAIRRITSSAMPASLDPCSQPLEDGGDALSSPDAHGHEGVAATGAAKLLQSLDGENAAGRPDRMAEGDPAPIGIGSVLRKAEV